MNQGPLIKVSVLNSFYDVSNWAIETAFATMLSIRNFFLWCILAAWEGAVLSTLAAYYVTESTIYNFTPWFLRSRKSLKGKVVVITGGAGGLGQELALRLARIKARVVVWDNNEKALEKVKGRLEKEGHTVYTYNVDVADRHNIYKNAELVKNELGQVDLLINNAGIVSGHTFLDNPDEMVEQTFKVNTLAHYWTIKAFLGDMIKAGEGHIVSVGSLTGSLGTYKCTDYSASKYALTGLYESLSIELKSHGHNIQTTLISPYFINTGMFAGCKPRAMPMLEPKDVSKRIIAAIRANETIATIPSSVGYLIPFKNYLPDKLNWVIYQRVIQGARAMKGLKGQQTYVHKLKELSQVQDVAAA